MVSHPARIAALAVMGNSKFQLMPEVRAAGYIAWRGLIEEPDLPGSAAAVLRNRFSFFEYPNSHMLVYLVPGACGGPVIRTACRAGTKSRTRLPFSTLRVKRCRP